MTGEHNAQIIPFQPRTVEQINGQQLDLGRMALDELVLLERQCSDRVGDAQLELLVVQDALGQRKLRGEI